MTANGGQHGFAGRIRSCFVHFESMTMLLMSFCAHEPSFLVHSARAWGRDAQIHHSHVNIAGVDD